MLIKKVIHSISGTYNYFFLLNLFLLKKNTKMLVYKKKVAQFYI